VAQVPYTKIAGLPPEAQRQIQRDFEEILVLIAAAGGSSAPSFYTSDSFDRAGSTTDLQTTDAAFGGTSLAWATTGTGTWGICNTATPTASKFAWYSTDFTGWKTAEVDVGFIDVAIQMSFAVIGSASDSYGIVARVTDNSNFYFFVIDVGPAGTTFNWRVGKVVAGAETTLFSQAVSLTSGGTATLKLTLVGSVLTAYGNGVAIWVGSDTAHSVQTKHGFGTYHGGGAGAGGSHTSVLRFDNLWITAP